MTPEVFHFLKEHVEPGAHVVCAVSGGPDSVALLHLTACCRDALGIRLTCAHYNHLLRGSDSDGDEAFTRSLSESLGIPFVCARGDVRAEAARSGRGVEETARELRYAFLRSVDPEAYLLTAHHADDNAETVLMHLLRGSGLHGLCGIAPVSGRTLRPLLGYTREELRAYLCENGLSFREDASNAEDDCLRNRLRHHVMPRLYAENPGLPRALTASCERLRDEDAYLESAAEELLNSAQRGNALDCGILAEAPVPLLRRTVRRFLKEVPELSGAQIDAVCGLIRGLSPSARIDLPGGYRVGRVNDLLRLTDTEPPAGFPAVILPTPGSVSIPSLGLTVRAERIEWDGTRPHPPALCCALPHGALTVRPREPGDRIRLNGGTVTLKKLMIDRRIPRFARALVPVIADEEGLVAAVGIGVDLDRLPQPGAPALLITPIKDEAK